MTTRQSPPAAADRTPSHASRLAPVRARGRGFSPDDPAWSGRSRDDLARLALLADVFSHAARRVSFQALPALAREATAPEPAVTADRPGGELVHLLGHTLSIARAVDRDATLLAVGYEERARPGRPRVLLVDDDPDVLVSLGAFLDGAGMDVTRVPNGEQALRRVIAGYVPQLVVTDYAMPGTGGIDLLMQLHALYPGLPALIVTGFPETKELMDLPPAITVLRKPFRRKDLLDRCAALLRTAA